MKKISLIITVIMIIMIFNGCGQITSLSGKYVNEQDKSEYLKFSGKSTVVFCADSEKMAGTYSIVEDAVMLVFGTGENATIEFFAIEGKDTLIHNLYGAAYVKKTFWNYYWKWWLALSVIGFMVKKIFIEHKGIKEIIKDIEEEA